MTGPLEAPTLDEKQALALLADGTLQLEGRLVDASNATLFGTVTGEAGGEEVSVSAVYKPVRGERPLWDFPDGTLAGREVSAYLVSAATGWSHVPPTVLRDGPFGTGMVQLWIDIDETVDVPTLVRQTRDPRLRTMAVYDAVINNSDRKGGHILPSPGGHIFGCDHGVSFSVEDKLRTVLWQWRGQPFCTEELSVLQGLASELAGPLGGALSEHLTETEVAVTIGRVERLLMTGTFPEPSGDWPPVPWPPF